MQHIGSVLDAKPQALSHEYPVNYALYKRDKLWTLVEVKCRFVPMWQYPTLIMSVRKLTKAYRTAQEMRVPLIVVTKWTDHLGYLRIRDLKAFPFKTGGRLDRGDPHDIEQLYDIPISEFKLFPTDVAI